jgi:aspartate dehydrogenase
MSKLLKIGIVGCGAIGSSLTRVIVRDFSKQTKLAALYDIDILRAKRLSQAVSKFKDLSVNNLDQLINKSELVIECASARNSWSIAQNVLKNGRDIMIMSVGGVASYLEELSNLAKKYNACVYIPSGAISGIDALKAARQEEIKEVILITRKNPISFKGVKYIEEQKIRLDKLKKDKLLFSGKAQEAIKYFPQNINVAGVLSLAGIGQERTQVKIIASPKEKRNIHEVQIVSRAGSIFTRTENVLHPKNPKTSYLAVLSAVATLRQILEPIKIGT